MQSSLSSIKVSQIRHIEGAAGICYNTVMSSQLRKMIALDLDGTLLTADKRISDRSRKALSEAGAAGFEPVVVTGRPLSGLPEELEEIPQIRYAITSNGAVTTDLHSGAVLRSQLIPASMAETIIPVPEKAGWLYCVFVDGIGFCAPQSYQKLRALFDGTVLDSYVQRSRRKTDHIEELIRTSPGVENIWIVCETPGQASELSARILEKSDLQVFRTAPKDIELGAPGADKGSALRELYRSLGIQREDVIAIGDNHNDLLMLEEAGTAVAMGNATEEIRRISHKITDTNDNDGVAKTIEALCRGL